MNKAPSLQIRRERPDDIAAIRRVHLAAFDSSAEADLVDQLRRDGDLVISEVAVGAEGVIGHIAFSPVAIDHDGSTAAAALGLAPMAVVPDWQRRQVGSRLVEAGLERCRAAGHFRVIVLGHADYYPRFGFVPASRFRLTSTYEVPDEIFMAAALRRDAFASCSGVARYAPAFAGL